MNIKNEIKKLLPEIKEIRDDIHTHPELSFKEYRTTNIILDFLKENNIQIIDIGMDTGVVGFLKSSEKNAPTIALRADIDAIDTDNGPAHLCGHDYHTATLLCCAKFLSLNRDKLKSNVVFIFQPAEEVTEGAKAMINNGLFEKLPLKVDMIFGVHNRPEMADGTVRIKSGAIMARKSDFTITVTGKTGHSGSPHQCIDPITASASIINAVQTIVSRNVNPLERCVCAICSIHGGSTSNFAPENVVMTGSVRSLSDETHDLCIKRIKEITDGICKAYNCSSKIEITDLVPVLYNYPNLTEIARTVAIETVGKENIVETDPCLGSEDFAVFGKYIPSYFFWIGSGKANSYNPPWHSEDFVVGEKFLPVSAEVFCRLALSI